MPIIAPPSLSSLRFSAASRLLGRGADDGAGEGEEIELGAGLSMTDNVLSATGGSGGGVANRRGSLLVRDINLAAANYTDVANFDMPAAWASVGSYIIMNPSVDLGAESTNIAWYTGPGRTGTQIGSNASVNQLTGAVTFKLAGITSPTVVRSGGKLYCSVYGGATAGRKCDALIEYFDLTDLS